LATLDPTHSFRPIWKPSFISQLAPEDRCHLNGLGMLDGRPKYVTAVSQTDVADGWHGKPLPRGVIIDVETDRVVTDEVSMPHSPRAVNGRIYALDSGRGFLVEIDPATGKLTDIAFCPGFLRGLAIVGDYAVVTVSKPRHGGFTDLPIEQEMNLRMATPMCGVLVVDLRHGEIVEWVKLEGDVTELFAVEPLPGIVCPMSFGLGDADFGDAITFDPQIPIESV
ncbi:MAG: TIGR03032 family protein, partial [Stenotrophomonas sp.]|nr:TIGR03032 family protein [Stenotrophomonas sp.]